MGFNYEENFKIPHSFNKRKWKNSYDYTLEDFCLENSSFQKEKEKELWITNTGRNIFNHKKDASSILAHHPIESKGEAENLKWSSSSKSSSNSSCILNTPDDSSVAQRFYLKYPQSCNMEKNDFKSHCCKCYTFCRKHKSRNRKGQEENNEGVDLTKISLKRKKVRIYTFLAQKANFHAD
ncbi:hypothetical protein TNCT_77821 [Trichonephila clavata]|uniref:Uncharacterized protein n=1 Tax=Trichonephila clavata TaxID=2740835 RepID=A0A8X6M4P9_TRICU|nr:hypothetical protein TNCT_77821 [Trichonephila clavata]